MGTSTSTGTSAKGRKNGTTAAPAADKTAASAAPRKLRWTVPAADVSTLAWLDAQHSVSRSLQLLIREAIQRDGYIDTLSKPVMQVAQAFDAQPASAQPAGTGHAGASVPQQPSLVHPGDEPVRAAERPPAPDPQSVEAAGTEPHESQGPSEPEDAQEPEDTHERQDTSEPDEPEGTQVDMDSLFGR